MLQVQVSDDYGWPVDAKEAMAFALLADRTLHRLPGNLPAVTGARRPVMLGTVTSGKISSLDSRDTTPSC
jgi:anhydro-N-acetylmuramic acid kinase